MDPLIYHFFNAIKTYILANSTEEKKTANTGKKKVSKLGLS